MKYLVPCPKCGIKTMVESGQAGQMLHCSCGASLEVPSIRGLRELETVQDDRSAVATWSRRQGLAFLGIAIAALALISAAGLLAFRPNAAAESVALDIDFDGIRHEVLALSPAESVVRFQMLDSATPKPMSERL